jgi:hypothetical protein
MLCARAFLSSWDFTFIAWDSTMKVHLKKTRRRCVTALGAGRAATGQEQPPEMPIQPVRRAAVGLRLHGKAVQVDSIKPTLKAPETKLSKLK